MTSSILLTGTGSPVRLSTDTMLMCSQIDVQRDQSDSASGIGYIGTAGMNSTTGANVISDILAQSGYTLTDQDAKNSYCAADYYVQLPAGAKAYVRFTQH